MMLGAPGSSRPSKFRTRGPRAHMLEPRHLVIYWNNVRAVTMRFLREYPEEQLGYRPVDTVFTALDQFQHLISSQTMFVRGWTTGVWDFPWRDGRWQASELVDQTFQTLPGLSAYYSNIHHRAVTFLRALPERGGSFLYETHLGPLRVDAMVLYAIDEEIHHRAQVGIYMRMLGIKPPPFLQRYQDLTAGPMDPA